MLILFEHHLQLTLVKLADLHSLGLLLLFESMQTAFVVLRKECLATIWLSLNRRLLAVHTMTSGTLRLVNLDPLVALCFTTDDESHICISHIGTALDLLPLHFVTSNLLFDLPF